MRCDKEALDMRRKLPFNFDTTTLRLPAGMTSAAASSSRRAPSQRMTRLLLDFDEVSGSPMFFAAFVHTGSMCRACVTSTVTTPFVSFHLFCRCLTDL
jgi:hypothetical protein